MSSLDNNLADSCRFEYPWEAWKTPTDYMITLGIVSTFLLWLFVAVMYSMYFSYPTTRRDIKRIFWSNRLADGQHLAHPKHFQVIPGNVRSPGHRRTVLQLPDRSEILSKIRLLEDSPKRTPSNLQLSSLPEMKSERSSSTAEFEPPLPFPGGKLSTTFTGTIDI